jgi:tight adherence protein B
MIIVLILIFLGITLIVSFSLLVVYRRYYSPELQAIKRLEQFTKTAVTTNIEEPGNVPFIVRDNELSKIPIFNIFLTKLNFAKGMKTMIEQADLKFKVGELFLYILIMGVMGFLLTARSTNPVLKIGAIVGLAYLPIMFVKSKRSNRLKSFIREFPDALDMMTSAIRAGHGLNKAFQLVGEEAPDPISTEFKRTYEEHNLGVQFRDALINLTERIDSLDLKLFVTAVLLQRETGGNMAEMLEKISYTIRERFKLIGQIRALTTQGRMSGWVVGGLPIFFIIVVSIINPKYLEPLFNDVLGHYLLGLAATMQICGALIIRKVVQVKFQ